MNAEINNGQFILFNDQPNTAGIEIHYAGNINIDPTLPDGWICRANRKKIIIFNIGNNKLSPEQTLFTFSGKLNIKFAFAATSDLQKINISTTNPKRNWDNIYYEGSDISNISEDWDSIQNKNESGTKKSYAQIVNDRHIKRTNKLLQAEKPIQTPSATTTRTTRTTTTGGY